MKIIGHRGAKGLAPENTLASFKKALEYKVDAVEFDVHVTRDHIPVINHDDFIPGLKPTKHFIAKYTFKELKNIKTDLLTLDQTLGFLQTKTNLIIEIKPKVNTEPVIDILRSHLRRNLKANKVTISSFDPKMLAQIKSALPELTLAVNEKWSGVRASRRASKLGTKYITMDHRWLWYGFIKSMSRNYKLSAYNLDSPRKAKRWANAGLHAVITGYPDRF